MTKDNPMVELRPAVPGALPPRTWRPMALWIAGVLLAFGLAWFVGAVVVPVWQTRTVVEMSIDLRFDVRNASPAEMEKRAGGHISRLGERERAARKLGMYIQLPSRLAPHKRDAVFLLGYCGGKAVAVLMAGLGSEDETICWLSARGLERIGPEAEEAIPALLGALRDERYAVRASAALALGATGSPAEGVAIALSKMLDDSYDFVRQAAAAALVKLATNNGRAFTLLTEELATRGVEAKRSAAWQLGRATKGAKVAIKALEKLLGDEDEDVRLCAAEALKKIRDGADEVKGACDAERARSGASAGASGDTTLPVDEGLRRE